MQRIRKQFGAQFADAIAKCPTLLADLQEIRQHGVTIRRVGGHCQAYSRHDKKAIYIGSKCGLTYQLVSLAHEKIHVLVSLTPNPVPGKTGRQAFIDMCLDAETDAIEHEVVVVGELVAAGYKVDAHSMKWYRRYHRGGRAAIRQAIENAYTSNTGEKYPAYYGGWYDEVVKPQDRLPFHKLHGRVGGPDISIELPDLIIPPFERLASCFDHCARFASVCEPEIKIIIPRSKNRS